MESERLFKTNVRSSYRISITVFLYSLWCTQLYSSVYSTYSYTGSRFARTAFCRLYTLIILSVSLSIITQLRVDPYSCSVGERCRRSKVGRLYTKERRHTNQLSESYVSSFGVALPFLALPFLALPVLALPFFFFMRSSCESP